MIFLRVKNATGDVMLDTFPVTFSSPSDERQKSDGERYLRKRIETGIFEVLLVKENRVANSNSVFNAFIASVEAIVVGLTSHSVGKAREMADDYLHNMIKIHGNEKSIIERCIFEAEGMLTHGEFVAAIKQKMISNSDEFAEDICALSQEIRLVDYHIGSYNLLREVSSRISITNNHNLRKFLLGLSHLFFDALSKNHILLSLHDVDKDFACSFEYETFNSAMHCFIENIVKYAKPYSKVSVYTLNQTGELVFEMESIRIEKSETMTILERGVYGRNVPEYLRGSGIGMYQLKKALVRSGISFFIIPDHALDSEMNDVRYTKNTFKFNFPQ